MFKSYVLKFIMLICCITFLGSFVSADYDLRQSCYSDLTDYMSDIGATQAAIEWLENFTYEQLEEEFSRKYQEMSSFGIDLYEPLFSMRLHSYWQQTQYQHPPYSPYPVYDRTEQWQYPAKEFIIAEEYVTDPEWQEHFIWCSFMHIKSDDLENFSDDDYWYDSEIFSAVSEDSDRWNQIWYNTNNVYNYDNEITGSFDRLFVFPQGTQNDFFDKYSVIDSFPSNVVDLEDFFDELWWQDWEQIRGVFLDESGSAISYDMPDILSPVSEVSDNDVFPLFNFYQEIENVYPDFWQYLAINWHLQFDTLKEMIDKRHDHEYADLWSSIINSRQIQKYAYNDRYGYDTDLEDEKEELYEETIETIHQVDNEARQRLGLSSSQVYESFEDDIWHDYERQEDTDQDEESDLDQDSDVEDDTQEDLHWSSQTDSDAGSIIFVLIVSFVVIVSFIILFWIYYIRK